MQKCLTEKSIKKTTAFLVISMLRNHMADLLEYFLHSHSATWTRLKRLANFPLSFNQGIDQMAEGRVSTCRGRGHVWGMWPRGRYWFGALVPAPCTAPKVKVITAAPSVVAQALSPSQNNPGEGNLQVYKTKHLSCHFLAH